MPGVAPVWEKAIGLAKETGSWPPSTATAPTFWVPSYDDIDVLQAARVLDVPEGSGYRDQIMKVPAPYVTSGRMSRIVPTPDFWAFLWDLLLGEYSAGYYYPITGQVPSFCVTFEKGGQWFNALGAKIRSASLRYAAEEYWQVDMEISAYSCPPYGLGTTPSPTFGTIHVYPGWNTKFYINGSEVKIRTLDLNINNNIPESMHCSGDRYSYFLAAGQLVVDGSYSREFDSITLYQQEIQLTEFELKMELYDEGSNNLIRITLPRVHASEKPDFSDEENLVFVSRKFQAKRPTTGFQKVIRVEFV